MWQERLRPHCWEGTRPVAPSWKLICGQAQGPSVQTVGRSVQRLCQEEEEGPDLQALLPEMSAEPRASPRMLR